MKHSIRFIAIVLGTLAVSTLSAQDSHLARVNKINGKEIYILSQPVRQYEKVATVKTAPKLTSILTRGFVNESVSEKANQFSKIVIRKTKRKHISSYDAIVYEGGKKAYAIKFTDSATEENEAMAKVQRINGIAVYVLSEPVASYEVASLKWGGVKAVPFLTYGWINNSIEKDMQTYVKKIDNTSDPDAVVYSSGKSAAGIKFIVR